MNQSLTFLQNRQIHRTVLNNGMVVLAVENAAADIVAARIFVKAGSLWENREQAGLSHLVSAVLTRGTDRLSSLEIAERVESVGASLGTDSTTDHFLVSLKTVSSDFADILKLAAQLLRSPAFLESEVELERRLSLQAIRSQQEHPFTLALDQLRRSMYQDHPYAFPGLGTLETVSALQRIDLQTYHQTYFRPDNIIISLAGRIVPEEAIALVEQVFGDWQVPSHPLPALQLPTLDFYPHPAVTAQDTYQTIVMLGYPAPAVKSPDYAVLKLLNTYLGNGLSSRLFVELREKRGLAYEVSAFYPTRLEPSQFAVYMGTAAENTTIALAGLKQEVDRLRTTPLTSADLLAVKNKLLGQYALSKQTNAQIAHTFGWYEALGLGLEFDSQFQDDITSVTVETAQAAAERYFTEPYISLVGPATAVNSALEPALLH